MLHRFQMIQRYFGTNPARTSFYSATTRCNRNFAWKNMFHTPACRSPARLGLKRKHATATTIVLCHVQLLRSDSR
ncbi:uncharacterized protein BDR25DRAFT_24747 [Lindgomyces ingoldianus]|uniref:Uncharacterized protein n=1 Tax=Lindgomyces ingoldianus TaxID=673940 RepID=A0ACB6QW03_9PLEO|nr:uncharacterized protein BDR25DRAFT_24747 [Lindgomyces ingoldianus]KAF2471198.1 hypothetical protein BDR25DRAFT_24747 [Lindgomyces ingoldianus]